MSNPDLQRLSAALEYVDLAAGLYLAGGADHAARLLAAAAEQQLGDLVQLIDAPSATVDTRELLARIEAVLRRSAERPSDVEQVEFQGGKADLRRAEAKLDNGQTLELSEREVELLRYLARNAGRAVSREELLEKVWRLPATSVRTRTIDMHVARLREKLGDDAEQPKVISTVRGKGYMLSRRTP